jgi:hypothetical protein
MPSRSSTDFTTRAPSDSVDQPKPAHAASISDLQGLSTPDFHSPNAPPRNESRAAQASARSTKTEQVAEHLFELAFQARSSATQRLLRSVSKRLRRCVSEEGFHCGHPACPACQAKKAKAFRKRIETQLRRIEGNGTPSLAAFLTLTVPADDLDRGLAVLRAAFTDLRESRAWRRTVSGGAAFVEIIPTAPTAARRWLVHAHAILEVPIDNHRGAIAAQGFDPMWSSAFGKALFGSIPYCLALPDFAAMKSAWGRLVQRHSKSLLTGTFHLGGAPDDLPLPHPLREHWAKGRGGTVISLAALYVCKRERSKLLNYTPEQIEALLRFMPRKRLALFLSSWRGQSARLPLRHPLRPNLIVGLRR